MSLDWCGCCCCCIQTHQFNKFCKATADTMQTKTLSLISASCIERAWSAWAFAWIKYSNTYSALKCRLMQPGLARFDPMLTANCGSVLVWTVGYSCRLYLFFVLSPLAWNFYCIWYGYVCAERCISFIIPLRRRKKKVNGTHYSPYYVNFNNLKKNNKQHKLKRRNLVQSNRVA